MDKNCLIDQKKIDLLVLKLDSLVLRIDKLENILIGQNGTNGIRSLQIKLAGDFKNIEDNQKIINKNFNEKIENIEENFNSKLSFFKWVIASIVGLFSPLILFILAKLFLNK